MQITGSMPVNMQQLHNNLPVVIFQLKINSGGHIVFQYLGGNVQGLFSTSAGKMMNEPEVFESMTGSEAVEAFRHALEKASQTQTSFSWEGEFKYVSGSTKWLYAVGNPGVCDEGGLCWYGMFSDITDCRKNKQFLQTNSHMLQDMGTLARIGPWELDLETMKPHWAEEVYKIHELEPEDICHLDKALGFYEEAARPVLTAAIDKAIETGTPWDLELPLVTAKGSPTWVRTLGKATFKDGKAVKLYGVIQDILAKKQAEEQLRVIFEYSTDAHLLFDETGIVDCNHAALSMLKVSSREELSALHPASFSPEFQPDGRRSEEKAREMDSLAYEKGYHRFEWLHKNTSGEEFAVEVTLNPVVINRKRLLLVVWHDISERKLAEEKIRQSEALLTETQLLTHSGSWEMDLLSGYMVGSEEGLRILGIESPEILIDDIQHLIYKDDREIYLQALKNSVENGAVCDLDLRIVRPSGEMRYIHAIGKPHFDQSGKVIRVYGGILDITERKRAEQELRSAKDLAEQATLAKNQFLSTMSHEIRTPMNAVIGFVHLLLENNPRPDQLEYLKILKFSSENLLVLINDILDFSKIEAGKIELEEVDFNIRELVSNVRSALLQQAQDKGISLKLMVDEDMPEYVIGDPVRLGQILTNLVSNGVKFTPEGRVTISASLLNRDAHHSVIRFEVADTGIGIEKEQLKAVFESFTQASSSTTRQYGGTGLGLTITRRLLELKGSSIEVDSAPGKGSVFSFELSFKYSLQAPRYVKPVSSTVDMKSLKGVHLLLAEDNPINVLLARQFLKRWDVECDVAGNGRIALEMIRQKDYDLILMDLQMPEMDGYEATRAIRAMDGPKYRELPVVALTASAMLDIKDKAFEVGMNDYLSKPFNPEELYRKIEGFAAAGRKLSGLQK